MKLEIFPKNLLKHFFCFNEFLSKTWLFQWDIFLFEFQTKQIVDRESLVFKMNSLNEKTIKQILRRNFKLAFVRSSIKIDTIIKKLHKF